MEQQTQQTIDVLQNVTIGSDIRFNVQILASDEIATINILEVKAQFISKGGARKKEDAKKHFKFLRRYPIEPFVDDIRSTAHCLNNPTHYGYYTLPIQAYYHVYDGYGVVPFEHKKGPIKDPSIVDGVVYYTKNRAVVQVFFPGYKQKELGSYDLILTIKVYDNSQPFDHARTMTIRYDDFLKLVERGDTPSGISRIIIDDSEIIESDDIYVNQGALAGNAINLTLTNEGTVPIDISEITDWYEGD